MPALKSGSLEHRQQGPPSALVAVTQLRKSECSRLAAIAALWAFPNEEERMRRTAVLFAAASILAGPNLLAAQGANLAGHWTMVVDPNAPPPTGRGGGRGGLGPDVTISQDAKTLTVTRTTQAGEIKSVYNLDGSDSKNTMTMGGNSVDLVSQAKWVGSKLVIHTSMTFNGTPRETTMSLSLDQAGNLIVESTNPGRGGGSPVTTTTTYKKG